MQDYSIVDYDRLEKEMKGIKGAKAVWRRLLLLPKLIFSTGLVCFYLFAALMAFFLMHHYITGETPSLFGHQLYIAGDDSMSPVLAEGSLLFVQPMDPQNIAVGDIIAFRGVGVGQGLFAHRVTGVHGEEGGLWFTTRGDTHGANGTVPVSAQGLLGKVQYSLPFLGHAINFAGMGTGLLAMVVFPLILLVVFELRSFLKISARIKEERGKLRTHGGHIMLMEPEPKDSPPVRAVTPSAKAKVKARVLRKINGRSPAGLSGIKNISHREGNNNGSDCHETRATIIAFRRKATVDVPGKNPLVQASHTPNRYFRSKQKAEIIGRRKRYPNSRTRTIARSAYRYVKNTERFPT
ncbi:MAG TPA: signal peptidase I [Firmicutes bacterium]|nr:signal peptidase I [Bacillota bacterium]